MQHLKQLVSLVSTNSDITLTEDAIPVHEPVIEVAVGQEHLLFITGIIVQFSTNWWPESNRLYGMGSNTKMQLGKQFVSDSEEIFRFSTPFLIDSTQKWIGISGGYSHSVCLTRDHQVFVCG